MTINHLAPVIRFKGFTDAWEQRKLGELADIIGGGTPSTSVLEYWNGDIDWYAPAEIGNKIFLNNSEKKITNIGLQKSSARLLPVGTVLFTSRAGIGNTAILLKEGTTNQGFQSIVPKKNLLDTYFIFSRTDELKRYGEITGAGSTFVEVSGKQMSKMNILIPKIEEQKKIGNFFKQLDDTIALHQRELDLLKEQKKGFLQKMFPKKGENVPEIRFAGFNDAWEQRKLGEYGYFYYGKSAPKWSVTKDATTFCVRYGELYTKYGTKIDKIYSLTNIPKENLKFSTGNEVLVPRVGEDPLDFSKCSWLSVPDVAIGEMISVYNTKQNPYFMAIYFRAKMKYEFAKRVEGGNVSNLYYSYLEDIPVRTPEMHEQEKIAMFFDKLDDTIALHQCELEKLQEMKKAFLQKMFV